MHPNRQLLEKFYTCFQNRDYQGMADCYAPNAEFSDAIFTLKGKAIAAMWHMLLCKDTKLSLQFEIISVNDLHGRVRWESDYILPRTGRSVHNVVVAEFTFANAMIISHRDNFNFWRWTRMALGPMGIALGWLPMMRKRVQGNMNAILMRFIEEHLEYKNKTKL